MAIFNSAVLTKRGNELLIDAAAGNKITFTRMVVGCGEYTDAERKRNALEKMESLKDAKQEFTFSAYKKVSEQCLMLTAIISNKELAKGYKITEIGICGKISDDEEDFLCSIAVTNSMEESDTFPPYNGLQECQIVQDYYITISPDAEVTVITKGASVLIEDFLATIEETKKEFIEKIEALKKSFQDGVDKIFNYLKGLGFTPTDSSPDAICVAIQNVYDRRYSSGYADGRTRGHADVIADPEAYGISTGIKIENIKVTSWRADFGGSQLNYTASKTGFINIWFYTSAAYVSSSVVNCLKVEIKVNNVVKKTFDAKTLGYDPAVHDANTDIHMSSVNFDFAGINCNSGDLITIKVDANNGSGQIVTAVG